MPIMNCLDVWNAVKFQGYHFDLRREEILICLNYAELQRLEHEQGHRCPEAFSEDITSVVCECLSTNLSPSVCVCFVWKGKIL